jgi:hypothetical protein
MVAEAMVVLAFSAGFVSTGLFSLTFNRSSTFKILLVSDISMSFAFSSLEFIVSLRTMSDPIDLFRCNNESCISSTKLATGAFSIVLLRLTMFKIFYSFSLGSNESIDPFLLKNLNSSD